jgi:hypothetical protein
MRRILIACSGRHSSLSSSSLSSSLIIATIHRRSGWSLIIPLLLLSLISDIAVVGGTVTTIGSSSYGGANDAGDDNRRREGNDADGGHQYRSRPAGFGRRFAYGMRYAARLQYVSDDVHLCGNDGSGGGGNTNGTGMIHVVPSEDGMPGEATRFIIVVVFVVQRRGRWKEGVGWGEGGFVDRSPPPPSLPPSFSSSIVSPHCILSYFHSFCPAPPLPQTVAILARRGGCTYETKARIASQFTYPPGAVRYLVVYDDVSRDGDDDLVVMMPDGSSSGTTNARDGGSSIAGGGDGHAPYDELGMVFVSYASGIGLREYVNEGSTSARESGGPRILIDGTDDAWLFPTMDGSEAGLAFVLMMFGCVCSLSLFLNTHALVNRSGGGGNESGSDADENHLRSFLLGPHNNPNNNHDGVFGGGGGIGRGGGGGSSRRRGNGLRLLTMEEVETLPTMEYCGLRSSSPVGGVGEEDREEVELRDKSDLPYPTEEGETSDGRHDDDEDVYGVRRAASLHDDATVDRVDYDRDDVPSRSSESGGRGLCNDDYLPPTKDDGDARHCFNQRICSICLDEYEPREQIRVLPCQHTFHSDCIFPWLTERSPTCPLCKAMFEAVQCEVEDTEEGGGTATTTATGGGDGAAEGDDGAGASMAVEGNPSSSGEETSDQSNGAMPPPLSDHLGSDGLLRSSLGMRGRFLRAWGLFGGGGGDGALTHPLEEPLLATDDDIMSEDIV